MSAQSLISRGDDKSYTFCLSRSNRLSKICNNLYEARIQNTLAVSKLSVLDQKQLHKAHNRQEKKRKNDGWLPSSQKKRDNPKHIDYLLDDNTPQAIGIASCTSTLKLQLPKLFNIAAEDLGVRGTALKSIPMLSDLQFPAYIAPSDDVLRAARGVLSEFIPPNDLESLESILRARDHVMHWRPRQIKVILLAESHAHTPRKLVVNGPSLSPRYLADFTGPRGFIAHVNCLLYGENACVSQKIPHNNGTHQFWQLLGVCAYGYEYYESGRRNEVMHGGNGDLESRLRCKLNLLRHLQSLGIWLVDTNIFGWYMTQEQKFVPTKSGEVVRKPKQRPPPNLKNASLVVSWELYTKHVIRSAAKEGHLKAIIPIGKEVVKAVTLSRLNDVVDVDGCTAVIERIPPAPNAWIEGGYRPILEKLSRVIRKHV